MKILSTIGLSTIITAASLCMPLTSVSAQMSQEQRQHVTQSSSFSFNCDGNCNTSNSSTSFNASSEVKQSQSQSTGWGDSVGYKGMMYHTNGRNRSYNLNTNTDGKATIGWDFRGGTCYIRYTEANVRNYKYNTSAACDEGEKTIGGLKKGSLYRFQIKQNDGNWSDSMTLRAY